MLLPYKARIWLMCFIVLSLRIVAQVPQYIPYQSIAHDPAGQVKANTSINVQFRIYNTFTASAPAYEEVHNTTTNDFGYFNLRIGNGSPQAGTFSAITWQTGDVSYEIWLDVGGGFVQLGSRAGFLSVPYALYSANAGVTPTLSINAPNTITSPSTGNYSITVASPTLSLNSNSLSISNGNTIVLPGATTYSAGPGISIASGSITNIAPNQTVMVSGSAVTGSYPNYTVTSAPATTLSAGNSNISITGTSPNYSIASTPSLSLNSNSISISNGNTIVLPTPMTYSAGPGISIASGSITNTAPDQMVMINGNGVTGSYPNYTVTSAPATTLTAGNSNISITGTSPNYSIASTPSLSLNSNSISISNGNTIVLPTPMTYSAGPGISIASGSITNTAPDQTVTISGPGVTGAYPNYTVSPVSEATLTAGNSNITITGTSPNYSIASTPSLSLNSNSLSISNGNTIVLPPPITYSAGPGISIASGSITNTAPDQTVTISGTGVTGSYPNYTVTSASATTLTAGNSNISITGTSPNYTVSSVTPTLTGTGNAMVLGSYPSQTVSVASQSLNLAGNVLTLSNGGGSITLPVNSITGTGLANVTSTSSAYTVNVPAPSISYTSASGTYSYSQGAYSNTLNLSPQVSYTSNVLSIGSNSVNLPVWNTGGNAGTSPSSHYIGTSDATDFVTGTNGSERLRITSTGSVGIGTSSPAAMLDVNGPVKLGSNSNAFSFFKYGVTPLAVSLTLLASDVTSTFSVTGAQSGDLVMVMMMNNAGTSSLSISYATVSSANTVTVGIHTSSLINLTTNITVSYVIIRP